MDGLLGARVVGWAAIFALGGSALVLDDFRGGHELSAREPSGPLERRRAAVVPDPLKVWVTIGSSWRSPRLLTGNRPGQRHECNRQNAPEVRAHGRSPRAGV